MVAISDLLLLPEFQCRVQMEDRTVQDYAGKLTRGVEFPPIKVARVNGAAIVVDGFHRVEAHKAADRREIQAEVHEVTIHKARLMAALANTAHGLPLKSRDKRRVFRTFISGRGHYDPKTKAFMSYRELEAALGGIAPHTTLRNWMEKDFPRTFSKMGGQEPGRGDPLEETVTDPEEEFLRAALAGLREAVNAARGIKDPQRRGELVRAAQEAVAAIQEGGEWDPEEHETDF